jgi:hypothetical protein
LRENFHGGLASAAHLSKNSLAAILRAAIARKRARRRAWGAKKKPKPTTSKLGNVEVGKAHQKKWNELGEKAELQRGHSGVEPAKGLR